MNLRDACKMINSIPLSTVLPSLGIVLNGSGNGPCPFHESEGNKCLSINKKTNRLKCFHCGKTWSVIDIHCDMLKIPVLEVAKRFTEIDPPKGMKILSQKKTSRKKDKWTQNWRDYLPDRRI